MPLVSLSGVKYAAAIFHNSLLKRLRLRLSGMDNTRQGLLGQQNNRFQKR
jgi:hypothetical protein